MPAILEYVGDGDWETIRRNTDSAARLLSPPVPQARVYNNAAITGIVTATITAVTFNSERWDEGALHSTSANTGRLTAPITGLYVVGACVQWESNATGVRLLRVMHSNGPVPIVRDVRAAVNGEVTEQSVETVYRFAAGEYAYVEVYQTSGANRQINATGNTSPEFWMHRVSGYVNQGV